MRNSEMPPAKSAADIPSLQPPPTIWSQRVWPRHEIMVQGEAIVLDNSSHNKASKVSANSRLGGGLAGGNAANQMRSYIQAKVGAQMLKPGSTRKSAQSNVSSEDVTTQKCQLRTSIIEEWTWDADPGSVYLSSYLDKTDQELYRQCRENLEAINQCTQLQQAINDEMRTQAELDQLIYESMKAKTERLDKQTGISSCNEDQAWVNSAFNDLRKCVTDQAHAHHVYSQTLNNQSTAIQQSLDSHKNLMERTKQAQCTFDAPSAGDGKCTGKTCMSFVQATCVFESVRKPRLKLISELDYLSTQMKSIDDQLQDIDCILASLKESEVSDCDQWRFQIKLEEARTKHDFLSNRRTELERDLNTAGTEFKNFHLGYRDKMVEVANVFRQHRIRCDSTLRKSFSLLRAASRSDPDVLQTLDAHKESWLSPVPDSSTAKAKTIATSDTGSLRSNSSLKRRQSHDKNPLKSRKVCFGGTHYSDSGDCHTCRTTCEKDESSNHSTTGDDTSSDSSYEDAPPVQPEDKRHRKTISPQQTKLIENNPWPPPSPSTSSQRESETDSKVIKTPGFPRIITPSKHKFESINTEAALREKRKQVESNKSENGPQERHEESNTAVRANKSQTGTNNSVFCKDTEKNYFPWKVKCDSLSFKDHTSSAQEQVDRRPPQDSGHSPLKSKPGECKADTHNQTDSRTQAAGEHVGRRSPHTTIKLSTDSHHKQSPSKKLPESPTPKLCDSSSVAVKTPPFHKPVSQNASSSCDFESSGPENETSLLASGKKDQSQKAKLSKPPANRKVFRERTSVERLASKSLVLTSENPPSKMGNTTARSGEINMSSDTGKRRVAFSDLGTSKQPNEGSRHRASEHNVSTTGTVRDRGILKKPSDSNRPAKTVIVREDKVITSRVQPEQITQNNASESPRQHSQPQQSDDHHKSQPYSTQKIAKESSPTGERLEQKTDLFIPELTESSSSESSSSPEEELQPSDTIRQLTLADNKLKQMMLEQKRMAEEEDKINRLISKYANNRRGLGLLSKNFNNSETTMPFEKLSDRDATGALGKGSLEDGKEDRLEFDVETKVDSDSFLTVNASLGAVPRQVKVCTVRPISTVSGDSGQKKHSPDAPFKKHSSDKRQVDRELVARLREFEVTAGQFVVHTGELEGFATASVQDRERNIGKTDKGENVGKSIIIQHEKCLWSAQRYNDSQTDLNNNLSALSDSALYSQTTALECPGVSFETAQLLPGEHLCFRNVACERNGPLSVSPLRFCVLASQHNEKEARKSVTLQKKSSDYLNRPCTCQTCHSRISMSSGKSSGKSESVSVSKHETESTPWLHEAGYECYSPEEKLTLPDSDAKESCVLVSKVELTRKPLKSCLKKIIGSDFHSLGIWTTTQKPGIPASTAEFITSTGLSNESQTIPSCQKQVRPNTECLVRSRPPKQYQKRVQFSERVRYSNAPGVQFFYDLASQPLHEDKKESRISNVNNNATTCLKDTCCCLDCRIHPQWSCAVNLHEPSGIQMLLRQVKFCVSFQSPCVHCRSHVCVLKPMAEYCLHSHPPKLCLSPSSSFAQKCIFLI